MRASAQGSDWGPRGLPSPGSGHLFRGEPSQRSGCLAFGDSLFLRGLKVTTSIFWGRPHQWPVPPLPKPPQGVLAPVRADKGPEAGAVLLHAPHSGHASAFVPLDRGGGCRGTGPLQVLGGALPSRLLTSPLLEVALGQKGSIPVVTGTELHCRAGEVWEVHCLHRAPSSATWKGAGPRAPVPPIPEHALECGLCSSPEVAGREQNSPQPRPSARAWKTGRVGPGWPGPPGHLSALPRPARQASFPPAVRGDSYSAGMGRFFFLPVTFFE